MLQNEFLLAEIGFDTAENEALQYFLECSEKMCFEVLLHTITPHLQSSL